MRGELLRKTKDQGQMRNGISVPHTSKRITQRYKEVHRAILKGIIGQYKGRQRVFHEKNRLTC